MAAIDKNLQAVRGRISQAAQTAGRDPATVRLLAVSKTHPPAAIEAAHAAGQRAFGENYVQEALDKMDALRLPGLEWHMIGPLQSNKTRPVAERFDWVHTVDREKVARRLSQARPAGMAPLNVLVQVNVSGEDTKSGVPTREAADLARAVAGMPGLSLRGLMAIPEPTDDLAVQRARFAEVRACFEALRAQGLPIDTLSMGMTHDMESAIAEGATLVRIGTAIFGARAPRAVPAAAA